MKKKVVVVKKALCFREMALVKKSKCIKRYNNVQTQIQLKTLTLTNASAKKDFKWISSVFVTAVTRKLHIGILKLGNAYVFRTFSTINSEENAWKREKNADQTNIMAKKDVNALNLQ